MKIILLCSLPGDFDLDQACRREAFSALQTAFYQALPREAAPGKTASGAYIYYCSPLPAAAHTLRHAFGQVPVYEDRGWIDRAIFAVGKQDMNPDGLTPLNTQADVLGASSDHLIMDVTKENYKLGDTVDFSLDYGALLKLFTSEYIDREYF